MRPTAGIWLAVRGSSLDSARPDVPTGCGSADGADTMGGAAVCGAALGSGAVVVGAVVGLGADGCDGAGSGVVVVAVLVAVPVIVPVVAVLVPVPVVVGAGVVAGAGVGGSAVVVAVLVAVLVVVLAVEAVDAVEVWDGSAVAVTRVGVPFFQSSMLVESVSTDMTPSPEARAIIIA